MESKEKQSLKFYADTPSGQVNKFFVFKVKSYEHAIDLAARFVQEYNFKIRAAYYQNLNKKGIRFDNMVDLKDWQNSIIEEQERETLLRSIKGR